MGRFIDILHTILSFFASIIDFILRVAIVIVLGAAFYIILGVTIFAIVMLIVRIKNVKFKFKYTKKNVKKVDGALFMPYCRLPKDKNFFKRAKLTGSTIFRTVLPKIDLNDYCFENVTISNIRFSKHTKLPNDKNFFQKIEHKSIVDCVLPVGDYSDYNFEGVSLTRVVFREGSILPTDYNLFSNLSHGSFVQLTLPRSFAETCHLYDYTNIHLYLDKKIKIPEVQHAILFKKYGGSVINF